MFNNNKKGVKMKKTIYKILLTLPLCNAQACVDNVYPEGAGNFSFINNQFIKDNIIIPAYNIKGCVKNLTQEAIETLLKERNLYFIWDGEILMSNLKLKGGMPPKGRPPEYNPYEERLPEQIGVYRVKDQSGQVQYVGSSNNVNRRISEHKRSGTIVEGDIVSVTKFHGNTGQNTVGEYEKKEIKRLNPKQNEHPGAPGRPWGS